MPHSPAIIGRTLARSFAMGLAGGLRSAVPGAVIADAARTGRLSRGQGWVWDQLRRPAATPISVALMLGEMVGDKLPVTPPRNAGGALYGRLGTGAIDGALVASGVGARSGGLAFAAAAGLAGAWVGAHGGYYARKAITDSGVPDLPVALIEDVVAVTIARLATAREL